MASPHYGTRLEADEYHAARANAAWGAASEASRDAALVRASSYIDGHYRSRFPGRKAGGRAQALEWPRKDATDAAGEVIADGEVPAEIVAATFEAALRELRAPGSLAPDFMLSGAIKTERKKVGPIEKEIEYATAADAEAARPVVSLIDDLLSGLLGTAVPKRSSSSFLLRA